MVSTLERKPCKATLIKLQPEKIDKTIKMLKFCEDHPPKISLNHFYFEG